jgi:uncharacterized membrane protein YebE (DUF533 family)
MATNFSSMLDGLMGQARDLARRGEDMAAERLGVGDDAESRDRMKRTALGGAGAAAALGLLLGTRTGRSLTRTGLLAGGLGYLGKVAYDAWRARNGGGDAPAGAQAAQLDGPAMEGRAHALLAAMVAAAKADGHVDDAERAMIEDKMAELGADARATMAEELARPLDARAIAAMADSDQAKAELYTMSVVVAGGDHPMERAWLDSLARELALPEGVAQEIEARVAAK